MQPESGNEQKPTTMELHKMPMADLLQALYEVREDYRAFLEEVNGVAPWDWSEEQKKINLNLLAWENELYAAYDARRIEESEANEKTIEQMTDDELQEALCHVDQERKFFLREQWRVMMSEEDEEHLASMDRYAQAIVDEQMRRVRKETR